MLDRAKYNAWMAVAKAKDRFELVLPAACDVCGRSVEDLRQRRKRPWMDVLQAHHHLGYDHPLDVWWVCASCHKRMRDRCLGECGQHTLDEVRQVVA